MISRRGFGRSALAGLSWAALSRDRIRAAAIDSIVRGVKLGITTASLNPLPEIPGRERIDILIEQCKQLGVGSVELASGFFGPPVLGTIGGQAPKQITPEYQKSRDALREWRLSPATMDDFRNVRKKFEDAGLELFSISNTFADDVTDAEIDVMFRQMQTLNIRLFQTNQTRVSMGPRLVPFARKYKIMPSFHTHAEVDDPNEIASVESLAKLLALSGDFRICLDIGHFTAGNNDAVAYLREHHDRITHLHVKDRKKNKGPNVAWGAGDTPIRECLTLIRDNRYPIRCIIEREFKGTETPFEETRQDLEYMKRILLA
jgi:sugar phosphate isomerase/epimerase